MRNQLEGFEETEVSMAKFREKLEGLSMEAKESQTAYDSRFGRLESRLSSIESKLESILKLLSTTNTTDTSNPTVNNLSEPAISKCVNGRPKSKTVENMVKNLKMPVFDGFRDRVNKGIYWICEVERFFECRNYSEDEKLRLASMSLNGEALNWFNRQANRAPFADWNDFRTKFLDLVRLYALRQERSLSPSDYADEFEILVSEVRGLDDDILERIFWNGLKPESQESLMFRKPQGLDELIGETAGLESSPFYRLIQGKVQQGTSVSRPIAYKKFRTGTVSRADRE